MFIAQERDFFKEKWMASCIRVVFSNYIHISNDKWTLALPGSVRHHEVLIDERAVTDDGV